MSQGGGFSPPKLKIVNFLFTVSPSGINSDSLILRHSEQDASTTQWTLSLSLKKEFIKKNGHFQAEKSSQGERETERSQVEGVNLCVRGEKRK